MFTFFHLLLELLLLPLHHMLCIISHTFLWLTIESNVFAVLFALFYVFKVCFFHVFFTTFLKIHLLFRNIRNFDKVYLISFLIFLTLVFFVFYVIFVIFEIFVTRKTISIILDLFANFIFTCLIR